MPTLGIMSRTPVTICLHVPLVLRSLVRIPFKPTIYYLLFNLYIFGILFHSLSLCSTWLNTGISHGQEAKQNTRAKKIQEMLYNEETQLVWRNLVSFSFMSVDYLHIPLLFSFSLQPFSKLKDFTNGVLL